MTRPGRVAAALAACAAVLIAGVVTVVIVARGSHPGHRIVAGGPVDGSTGIGDPSYPTYGNGGYDVTHYRLLLDYVPASGRLEGVATVTMVPAVPLRSFHLDLLLHTDSVVVNGVPARFVQREGELVVTPRTVLTAGAPARVEVRYGGNPGATKPKGISRWTTSPSGAVAVGEPEIAAWWFPSNDHPRDKATYDVDITVPAGLQAVSNGTLLGSTAAGPGATTWRWQERDPMATYLAFLAIGHYDLVRGRSGRRPFLMALAQRATSPGARSSLSKTPAILDWLEEIWGPYPFDSSGAVVPDVKLGFALENQTRPVYSPGFFAKGPNDSVVVHENAHEWFGDSVSVTNWRDIWLNEGFATFSEWLWAEHRRTATAASLFTKAYRDHPADDQFWKLRIGDPDPGKEFDRAVYVRGAMALQALRTRIGDFMFFQVTRAWLAARKFGNASVEDFIRAVEQATGDNLDNFFSVWLFTAAKPLPTKVNGFVVP
jgi:aminopeptidase N